MRPAAHLSRPMAAGAISPLDPRLWRGIAVGGILAVLPFITFRFSLSFIGIAPLLSSRIAFYGGFAALIGICAFFFNYLKVEEILKTFVIGCLAGVYFAFGVANGTILLDSIANISTHAGLFVAIPLGYFLGRAIPRTNFILNDWVWVLISLPLLLSLLSYLRYANLVSFQVLSRQFAETGPVATHYAYFAGMICVTFFALALITRNVFVRSYFFFACIVAIVGIIITESRMAFVFAAVTMLYLLAVAARKRLVNIRYLLTVVPIVFVVVAVAYTILGNLFFLDRFHGFNERLTALFFAAQQPELDLETLTTGRNLIWAEYWELRHEWIFAGYSQIHLHQHPHNLLYEIIVRYGLFGFPLVAFLIASFGYVGWRLFFLRPRNFYLIPFAAVFLFSFLQSMTSMGFQRVFPVYLLAGLCLCICQRDASSAQKPLPATALSRRYHRSLSPRSGAQLPEPVSIRAEGNPSPRYKTS